MAEYNDSFPRPLTLDPTVNVKDLVRDIGDRFDSLRGADIRLADSLRLADHRTLDAEFQRIKELMEMRATYTEKLEVAEAKRIDAIRLVDTNAVAIANQRATEQAAVLANQVSASAETLRILVSQTATAAKGQLDQTTSQLSDRITVVERSLYEGRGNAGNIAPAISEQFAQLQAQLATLQESRFRNEGRSGISAPLLATMVAATTGIIVFIVQRLLM